VSGEPPVPILRPPADWEELRRIWQERHGDGLQYQLPDWVGEWAAHMVRRDLACLGPLSEPVRVELLKAYLIGFELGALAEAQGWDTAPRPIPPHELARMDAELAALGEVSP
jgi:hypothetical protein